MGERDDPTFGGTDHLEMVLPKDLLRFLCGKVEVVNERGSYIPRRHVSGVPISPPTKHSIDIGQEKQTILVGKAEDDSSSDPANFVGVHFECGNAIEGVDAHSDIEGTLLKGKLK
jgi:hypothetical protein